jgi:hypothetical protein
MKPQDDVQIDVVSALLMAIGASVMVIALWIGLIKTGVVM